MTMQHGETPLPLFTFASDGGTFGTYHENGSVGGYWKRLDYFADYSGYGTQNSTPDSQFHRDAYIGNLGFRYRRTTSFGHRERVAAGYNSANRLPRMAFPTTHPATSEIAFWRHPG